MVEDDRGYRIKLTRTTTNAVGTKSSSVTTNMYLDPPGTPPGLPTITSPTKPVGGSTVKVEWTGAEPGGWFECSTDWGVTWKECTSGMELTGLKDGPNSFYLVQRNDYGSWGAYLYGSITTDQQKPYEPQIWNYPSPWVDAMGGQFEWSGEGKPENTFECQEDDGAWVACTSPHTVTATTEGQHTFRVRETDGVGLVSDVATRKWTAKTPAPPAPPATPPAAPTRVSGPAELTKNKVSSIAFTGADPAGTGFECRIDAGAWAACTSPFTTPTLADGAHTADVRQLNAAGPGAVLTTAWTVDTVRPASPTMVQQPIGSVADATARFVFTVEAGATAECQLDSGAWMPCASPFEVTGLAVGAHRVVIRQTDAAGNVSNGRIVNWSVSTPPSGVVAAPTVEAPAPATPAPVSADPAPSGSAAAPAAAATTPKAAAPVAPAAAAKPKLVADLGTGSTGNGNAAATPVIAVSRSGVDVGCSAAGTILASCTVRLYAQVPAGTAARAAAATKVLVGTGTYRRAAGARKATVAVALNATGRALLRRSPGGLKVSVAITGKPVSGGTLKATGAATLLAGRVTATVEGFAVDRAELTAAAKRQLATLARQVGRTAKTVRVVGHTDGSTTDSAYLKRLGERRARTVAAYLRAHGVRANATLVSRGATRPRATNATAAGRALNRRVELRVER